MLARMPRLLHRLVLVAIVALSASLTACTRAIAPGAPSASHTIIPAPVSVESAQGDFHVTASTTIVVPPNDEAVVKVGRYLSALIGVAAGPQPPAVVTSSSNSAGAIYLTLTQNGEPEAY